MNCPMYKDFTRECAEKFEEVIHISNFDICDSDRYKECPFFRILNEPEKLCEYADKCIADLKDRGLLSSSKAEELDRIAKKSG